MKRIPDALLDKEISGYRVTEQTLRAELGDAPTLLLFLRHFG